MQQHPQHPQMHPQQQPPYGYAPPPQPYGYPPQQQPYGYPPQQQQYYPPPQQHPHAPQQHTQAPPPQQAPQQQAPPSAAAAAPAPGVPYIGARISLISTSHIRYEGTLYTIDTKAMTVALQHVRCFGTETRGSDGQGGGNFLPPSQDIYEYVVFEGKDIGDLAVLQQQTPPEMPPPQQQQPEQPQVEAQQQEVQPAKAEYFEEAPALNENSYPRPQRGGRQHQQGGGGGKHTVRMINDESAPRRQPNQPRANQQQQRAPAAAASVENPAVPFDFESSNAKFQKLDASTAAAAASSEPSYDLPSADAASSSSGLDTSGFPVVTKKYDKKKSFFDDLTPESRTMPSSQQGHNRRSNDVATFGAEAAQGYRSQHARSNRGGGGNGGGNGGGQRRGGGGGGNRQWRQSEQQ